MSTHDEGWNPGRPAEMATGATVESAPLLGILMLNTRFPRIPGDIGNPSTFSFPVRYEVVEPALVKRIVNPAMPPPGVIDAFAAAAARLEAAGVRALATSCGFLALLQHELGRRCRVPLLSSSLLQVAMVAAGLPAGRRVGVLTFNSQALTPAHLQAAGAPPDTPVVGIENGRELFRVIWQDLPELDPKAAEDDVLKAGEKLLARAPDVGAVVLECTNMAPYARALAACIGLPVFDVVSLLEWWCGGLLPRNFAT